MKVLRYRIGKAIFVLEKTPEGDFVPDDYGEGAIWAQYIMSKPAKNDKLPVYEFERLMYEVK